MKIFVTAYVGAMVAMIALDAVWLSTMEGVSIALNWDICSPSALAAAQPCFLCAVSLWRRVFRDHSRAESGGWRKALFNGALLGLVA